MKIKSFNLNVGIKDTKSALEALKNKRKKIEKHIKF